MNILIVAATEDEIAPSRARGYHDWHQVDFLVTGVGMTATAYQLGRKLQGYRPDLMLNVGVCGSFDRTIALGDLVRVKEDTFAELGAEDGEDFLIGDKLGFGASSFSERIDTHFTTLDGLPAALGITVNTVHGHAASIERIAKRISPNVESMEGAAVFYAAHQEQIQCLQIRAVSNYVERRNRANWQLDNAIASLNEWLINFLMTLPA